MGLEQRPFGSQWDADSDTSARPNLGPHPGRYKQRRGRSLDVSRVPHPRWIDNRFTVADRGTPDLAI